MKKLLIAAVAVLMAGSAYAQSGPLVNVAPNLNIVTQLIVSVPINASPSTAVAFSVNGQAIARATSINTQTVLGNNATWINMNFNHGY